MTLVSYRFDSMQVCILVLAAMAVSGIVAAAQSPSQGGESAKSTLQPEVATLLREATAAYQKMQSYQHTAEYVERSGQGPDRIKAFTLALERPNKFCYRSDSVDDGAAVSDGKIFTNYKIDSQGAFYTRTAAPDSFGRIDIVNDVTFQPIGTYLIALMLQGNVLSDHDIRAYMEKATAPKSVVDDGIRYETLSAEFQPAGTSLTLYFNAQTHLLHKAVEEFPQNAIKVIEIIENVKIDKKIVPVDLFQYAPPKNALWIVSRVGSKASRQFFEPDLPILV